MTVQQAHSLWLASVERYDNTDQEDRKARTKARKEMDKAYQRFQDLRGIGTI